jgi:hypothetical protein
MASAQNADPLITFWMTTHAPFVQMSASQRKLAIQTSLFVKLVVLTTAVNVF